MHRWISHTWYSCLEQPGAARILFPALWGHRGATPRPHLPLRGGTAPLGDAWGCWPYRGSHRVLPGEPQCQLEEELGARGEG